MGLADVDGWGAGKMLFCPENEVPGARRQGFMCQWSFSFLRVLDVALE
jgi:hypothetical protein